MKIICIIIVVILLLIIIKWGLLALYCRIQCKLDAKRYHMKQENNNKENDRADDSKISFAKKIYHFINGYVYGYMRYKVIKVGHIPSHRIRNIIYRAIFGMKITKKTVIYGGCEIRSPWNIKADNCVISTNCILDGRNGITIGENAVFGSGVHVWTEEHDVNDAKFGVSRSGSQPVVIGKRAWICSDSTILPGVTVGDGAVLASRAVATKDCAPFTINAGIPARKINNRNTELDYELNGKPHWHFW